MSFSELDYTSLVMAGRKNIYTSFKSHTAKYNIGVGKLIMLARTDTSLKLR